MQPRTRSRSALALVPALPARAGTLAVGPGHTPTPDHRRAVVAVDGHTRGQCPDRPGEEATPTHHLVPALPHLNPAAAQCPTVAPQASLYHDHHPAVELAHMTRVTREAGAHTASAANAHRLARSHLLAGGEEIGASPAQYLDQLHRLASDATRRLVHLHLLVGEGMILAHLRRRVGGGIRCRCRGLRRGGVGGCLVRLEGERSGS